MNPEEPIPPIDPTTDPATDPAKEPVKTGNIPRADVDLGNVANEVNTKWLNTPAISLIWKSQAVFGGEVLLYITTITEKKTTKGSRSPLNNQLLKLHDEIDVRTENIKGYLEEKYGKKDAPAYYPVFGIVKQFDKYKLPLDRNDRVIALELMVSGCATEGFNTPAFTYGFDYWNNTKSSYSAFVNAVGSIDGTVTGKVSTKNTLKKEIRKVLNSLIHVIKGNYPDTWKDELRVWGFQKEKY